MGLILRLQGKTPSSSPSRWHLGLIYSVRRPCGMKQAARWSSSHKKMHVHSWHRLVKTTRHLWWRCVSTKTGLHLHGGLP